MELRAPPRMARVSPVTAVTTFRRTRRDRVRAEAPRSIGDTTTYHDRRTPSTASRAPQSGVCIAPSLRRARRSQTSTPRLSARRRDPGVLKTSPRRRLDRARSVAREDRATSRRACASSTRARVSAAEAAEADRRWSASIFASASRNDSTSTRHMASQSHTNQNFTSVNNQSVTFGKRRNQRSANRLREPALSCTWHSLSAHDGRCSRHPRLPDLRPPRGDPLAPRRRGSRARRARGFRPRLRRGAPGTTRRSPRLSRGGDFADARRPPPSSFVVR